MLVGKTGRTTQLRQGRITAVGVSVNVGYAGRTALFVDQIAIQSVNASPFSAGGDSGSSIWTWNSARNPVGLLFAGGGGTTFAIYTHNSAVRRQMEQNAGRRGPGSVFRFPGV